MNPTVAAPLGTPDSSLPRLSDVLDLPDELIQDTSSSIADAGTPLAAGEVMGKPLYRYRDAPKGHEHFEVQD